ncbi:alcohol dehydrogenase catalytic domain-containing protein [Pseudonocardia zijingensis]|uniref:Enoyl reductase (ER) domain-containing protein n=1 Tax=Pseudonocardia zijingensis TaxID=153376 RepID=A0ABN1QAI4_9PSEU
MTTSARAAVLETQDGPFEFRDIEIEDPRPDEVLVRVVATGICATDAHVRAQRMATPLPVVLGHEGAGVVERVGAAVTTVEPGDHVVLSYHSCGRCKAMIDAGRLTLGQSLQGIIQGDAVSSLLINDLAQLYRAGRFPIDRLLSFYDFSDINTAFEDAGSGRATKAILRFTAPG